MREQNNGIGCRRARAPADNRVEGRLRQQAECGTCASLTTCPLLTSGDVTLRAHRLDDAEAIVEQCTDPDSIRWTTVPLDYDLAMAESWVTTAIPARWEDGSERVFAIETHSSGRAAQVQRFAVACAISVTSTERRWRSVLTRRYADAG